MIQCLLWDFGDTLCDERFIWSSGPEWMEAYETFAGDGVGAAWSLGEIDTREFAAELSKRMELDAESIVAHMIERCNHIEFFAQTYAFFKARHLPQAIVTVNPDIFSDVIVPVCELASSCDAIVTSWEERTTDKRVLGELTDYALRELKTFKCECRDMLRSLAKQPMLGRWRMPYKPTIQ